VEAGADAIFVHSKLTTPDEIVSFARKWDFPVPLVICPTSYPMMTLDEIKRLKIKMVVYANQGLRASIKAINNVLTEIKREGRLDTVEDKIVSMQEVFELQGMTRMKDEEKVFLRTDEEPIKVIIPAAGEPRNQESIAHLLQDRPLAMLDINGKPLLQRNVETLNRSKLYHISVVTGYKNDAFDIEGVNYFHNQKYHSEHILSSIMCAESKMDSKTIIIYSDILFENSLIERLKSLESDFLVVVDNSFKKTLRRNKKLDQIISKEELVSGERILTYDKLYEVQKIGEEIAPEAASAELIGITMFSKKGTDIFKQEYHKAAAEYRNKPFYAAKNLAQASLEDFLQYLIETGHKVEALQVNSGWMEIHSFDNYKYACSIVK